MTHFHNYVMDLLFHEVERQGTLRKEMLRLMFCIALALTPILA